MTDQRTPHEVLFEFLHGDTRIRCELVDHGGHGIEARFVHDDRAMMSQTFPRGATACAHRAIGQSPGLMNNVARWKTAEKRRIRASGAQAVDGAETNSNS